MGVRRHLFSNIENYSIANKIGRGKYSHVFEGTDLKNKKKVAIKVLVPIRPNKIRREYFITKSLDHPNIIKLVDTVKCSNLKITSLIF